MRPDKSEGCKALWENRVLGREDKERGERQMRGGESVETCTAKAL